MVMRSPSNTRTHHWLSSPFAINQIKSTSKRCQRPDALKHPIAHCKDGYGNWMRPSGSSPSGSPTETTTQDDAHPISTAGRLADNSRVIQARSLNWRKQSSSISKRFDSPKELVGETLSSRLFACYTHRCWGIGDAIPNTTGRKLCRVHHRTRSSGLKCSSSMNSLLMGNQSTGSAGETSQHGKAGWTNTPRLPLWGKQGGSRSSKKPAHAGLATGMLIAHRRDTPANTISDPRSR